MSDAWEYMVVRIEYTSLGGIRSVSYNGKTRIDKKEAKEKWGLAGRHLGLNELGKNGWDFIYMERGGPGSIDLIYLKRKVE
jgi:hypothetical protein